jgi:molecular chaperone GrpE
MSEKQKDEERERPKIRITDKRRVRPDDDASPATAARGGGGVSGASEASEASRRSGAAPASAEPRPQGGEETSELEKVRADAAEYLDHLQRLKAEFDNYRKRVLKEQTRAVEQASEPLVHRLLEVLDEFDLALMAAERKPDFDQFLHGVELVYAKLLDILRSEGLERIDARGKPFDPERHEALMQTGEDSEGDPRVADVLRQGYTLKGRVIRPAGVKVTRN